MRFGTFTSAYFCARFSLLFVSSKHHHNPLHPVLIKYSFVGHGKTLVGWLLFRASLSQPAVLSQQILFYNIFTFTRKLNTILIPTEKKLTTKLQAPDKSNDLPGDARKRARLAATASGKSPAQISRAGTDAAAFAGSPVHANRLEARMQKGRDSSALKSQIHSSSA